MKKAMVTFATAEGGVLWARRDRIVAVKSLPDHPLECAVYLEGWDDPVVVACPAEVAVELLKGTAPPKS